jgi:hypothetical protein
MPIQGFRDNIVSRFDTFPFHFNAFASQDRLQGEYGVDLLDRFVENPNAIPLSHQVHLGGGSPCTLRHPREGTIITTRGQYQSLLY